MNDIELANKVIKYLNKKAKRCAIFPKKYTPKEIANSVGGYAASVGRVANEVVKELKGRGIKIKYINNVNPRYFLIEKGIK